MKKMPMIAGLALTALPAFGAVQGVVVDAASGRPVAGATVKFPSGSASTVTDAQGRYVLSTASLPRLAPPSAGHAGARALGLGSLLPAGHAAFDASGRRAPGAVPADRVLLAAPGVPSRVRATRATPATPARSADAPCLIAVEAASYKPREANCTEGKDDTVAVVLEASAKHYYRVPVSAGDGWETGDLAAAVPNPKALLDGMDSLAFRRYKEVHSLLVVRGGKLVLEEYYKGNTDTIDFEGGIRRVTGPQAHWTRTGKHYVASVNKAITSIITGMALDKGGKTPAATLASLLPAYQAQLTGAKATITVEHALTMTLGFTWNEWGGRDLVDMWASKDIGAYVAAKPMAAGGPGSEWTYNSAGPNLLHAAVPALTGQDAATFARQNLFAPLGIEDFRWGTQPNGVAEGSAKMFMRPRDMAKLGYLYLKGGNWKGTQVVPAAWVTLSTAFKRSAKPKNPNDYAYLWWVRKVTTPKGAVVEYYQAEGDGGNYIVVVPSQDLVVVSTGGNYGDFATYDAQMGRLLGRHVLPAVGL